MRNFATHFFTFTNSLKHLCTGAGRVLVESWYLAGNVLIATPNQGTTHRTSRLPRLDSLSILSRQSDLRKFVASLTLLLCLGVGRLFAVNYCQSSAFGYGASATGGGSTTPVLVSTVDQLKSALNKASNKVIIITSNLTFTTMLSVQDGSNITLMGLPGVTLTNLDQTSSNSGILFFKRYTNLIIRNLTFVGPGAYDCDGNDLLCFENVTTAWVDHCDFQDGCDGNFDNKAKTDNVTVSWCRFRYLKSPRAGGPGGSDDHRYTNLLGKSSSDKPDDGTYNFTWAYCWWDNGCKERMVRCRNAELHFINCYWNSSVANYYVGPENAKCYFKGCTFAGNANSASKIFKSYGGTNSCYFDGCTGNLPSNSGSVSAPAYAYSAFDNAAAAVTSVTNASCGAGATLTVTRAGAVSSTCDGGVAPTIYTVTWDAATNSGSCGTSSTLVESGQAIGTLPAATKSGYTFDGWFTASSGGIQINASTTVSGNITYYAQFTEISGGGCSSGTLFTATVKATSDQSIASGTENQALTSAQATVSGGTMSVYNKETSSKTLIDDQSSHYYFTETNGKTFFRLDLDCALAAGDVISVYIYNNKSATRGLWLTTATSRPGSAPTATATNTSTSKVTYTVAMGDGIIGEQTIYLYRATDNSTYFDSINITRPGVAPTYTLSYDENGGSGSAMADQEGTTLTVAANTYTAPTGYAFQKWNTAMNGGGTDYSSGNSITLTEDVTLYAIWQPQTYTVSFDKQSGSDGTNSVTATFDAAMPSITVPTRTGYTFAGYYTAANGEGTQYYDGNGSSTNDWTIANNTTLYANWTEGAAPAPSGCDLHFHFFYAADATSNSLTNDATVFTSMVSDGSAMAGSITIDGTSYSVTRRTGDNATFGTFTIPSGKIGTFYALAVSSGAGDRQINLVRGGTTYELPVEGGSSSYKRLEQGDLPAGTYSIEREGSSNVRLGVVVVKLCDDVACADKYSFHYGTDGQTDWTIECFTKVGDTHEWNITNFAIPNKPNFYVGYEGSSNSQTQLRAWTDSYSDGNGAMKLLPTSTSILGTATGAVGTIRIYDNSGWKNQDVAFTPNGYGITYGGVGHAFNTTATANMWETDVVTLPDVSTTYTMGLATATSGTYVTCAHSSAAEAISNMGVTILNGGKKMIYLEPGSFNTGNAVYAVWDVTNSAWGDGTTKLFTDANSDGVWECPVASSCTSINLVRMSSGTTASNIDWSRKWNQTANISVGDLLNKYTITSLSGDNCAYTTTAMHPATGQKGKFRMWANSGDNNWFVHWIPYYVLTYDANEGSGAPSEQSISSETSPCQLTVSSTEPTRTDYIFEGWSTSSSAVSPDAAWDPSATHAMTGDVTLYAVWTACSGPNGGSATWTAAGYAYNQNAVANTMSLTGMVAGNGGALSYQWYKTTSDVAHGEIISGATENTYTPATDVVHAANWYYFCVVTEAGCSTTYTSALSGAITVNPVTYSITYNCDGADSGCPSNVAAATNLPNPLPDAPLKAGYIFDGWYTNAGKTDAAVAGATLTGNVTLYAKWLEDDGCIEWAGTPNSLSEGSMTVNTNLLLTVSGASIASEAIWSGSGNKTVFKIDGSDKYMQGHFIDDSEISTVTISAATNQSSSKIYAIVFCANSSFSSGVTVQTHTAPSANAARNDANLIHEFTAPAGTKYFRVYRKYVLNEVTYGDNQTIRVYGLEVCPAETYTVTYKANDGTGSDVVDNNATTISDVPGTFTAPGAMHFMNWNTVAGGAGDTYEPGDAVTSDLTLFAQWGWQLTYDANAGGDEVSNMPDAEIHKPGTYTLSSNVPTRAGYTFDCWNRNVGGTGDCFSAGASFTTGALNETLYAKWNAQPYTITLGAVTTNQPSGSTVGGTISASAASATAGTTITLTPSPTSGYAFVSWTVTKAGGGTVEVVSNQFTMPADNVTITAVFAKTYTIAYYENDGTTSIGGLAPTSYTYGVGAVLPPTPAKSGYTFEAWYNDWCVNESNEAPCSSGCGWVAGCQTTTISTVDYGDADYLARWYQTVTLDKNGGDADGSVVAWYNETEVTSLSAPTRAGYEVEGYYAEAGCTNKVMTAAGALVDYSGYVSSGKWIHSGATTLYAKWTEEVVTYSVTYNGNGNSGGSVPTDATAYDAGDIVTVKGNTGSLTKTGYVFRGWNTASDYSGTFYPADYKFEMPSSNVTLYAVWGTGRACVTITHWGTSNATTEAWAGSIAEENKYKLAHSGSNTSNNKSTDSNASIILYYGTTMSIYDSPSETTGFTNVTSVSFKVKLYNASKKPTITVSVGSGEGETVTLTDNTDNSTFKTYTVDFATPQSGAVKFRNNGSGDSGYKVYLDDIEICTGSGSSGYTVTFDNNGEGTYSRTIENVPSGSKIGEPIPAPTAEGNTFGGWYKEAGCSNAWDFATDVVSSDKTLYAKWTNCLPGISTQPVGNTYTQGTVAAALTVTTTGDVTGYQWYSNDENNATTGTPIDGATIGGYTPETGVIGTTYYYCVVTNACGSVASNVVAIIVNDGKETPCASWTVAEPTHGGQGFSFSVVAKKHDCSTLWDGTLTAAMLTADEDVVLSDITVNNTTKTISGTYGVKGTAESLVTFYLTLPATDTQSAATLSYDRSFTACEGGAEEFYWSANVSSPLTANTAAKLVSKTTAAEIALSGTTGASTSTRSTDNATGIVDGTTYNFTSSDSHHTYIKMGSGNEFHFTTIATATISVQFITCSNDESGIEIHQTTKEGTLIASKLVSSKQYKFQTLTTGSVAAGTYYVVAKVKEIDVGEILVVQGSGNSGTETTSIAWSNSQADGATVEKNEDAADFTITATRSNSEANASLGAISYSSSNTAIATVNATTGQVHIADNIDFGSDSYKTTTITATLAASGCYKRAAITYVLQVNKFVCAEAAGTVSIKTDNGCSGKVLTVTGFEAGATGFQWYKNGDVISGATSQDYTATTSGEYSVVTRKTCDVASSNSISVSFETAGAEAIVDEWYVKKDRRTPDIALVQTTNATSFTVTNKSGGATVSDIGGCTFYLGDDGIIYLKGEKANGDEPAHEDGSWEAGDITLVITASACGGSSVEITIHKQAATAKPSIAFVVDGGEGKAVNNVTAAKTTSRALWTYLSADFTLTGCNAYWTIDEKALRQYYSQYDAILITDDPNTKKPNEKTYQTKGYVNALGTLIDVRPLLTMEAFVSALANWSCVKGKPISPSPRDYVLKLQCKEHAIYNSLIEDGSLVRKETVDGIDNWYVTMVDASNSTYSSTDDEDDAEGTPALQGFDGKVNVSMLGIGTIASETLQGGIERQKEPAARMMVLGVNNKAMAALTSPGKEVIKNALHYLLLTDMESLEDCSNYFIGGTIDHETDWQTAANWTSGKVPDPTVRARILAPCEVSGVARASAIDIAVGGRTTRYQSGGRDCEGQLTINADGALIVVGGIGRIESAPNFGITHLQPTEVSDLVVLSEASGSGALIFDNPDGNTKATVDFYSKAYTSVEGGVKKKHWQYYAIPIHEAPIPQFFYGAYTYLWEEPNSAWVRKRDGSTLYEWDPLAISYGVVMDYQPTYRLYGELTSTEDYTATLTHDGSDEDTGKNLIGNSWTAPLQIANFDEEDFGENVEQTVYIHNTGRREQAGGYESVANDSDTPGQWISVAINAPAVGGYEGIKVISSLQAFEVHTSSASTLKLNYNRLVRGVPAADLNTPMRAPKRINRAGGIDPSEVKMLKVQVADQKTRTSVYIFRHEGFSDDYDNGWDARYSEGSGESATLYAVTPDGNMAMAAIPEIDGTELVFAPGQVSEYTFSFKYTGDETLYLNDMQLEKSTLINAENTYTFTYSENDMVGRFVISRQAFGAPPIITGNDNISDEAKPIKFIKDDKIFILVRGVLYDITGKVVK